MKGNGWSALFCTASNMTSIVVSSFFKWPQLCWNSDSSVKWVDKLGISTASYLDKRTVSTRETGSPWTTAATMFRPHAKRLFSTFDSTCLFVCMCCKNHEQNKKQQNKTPKQSSKKKKRKWIFCIQMIVLLPLLKKCQHTGVCLITWRNLFWNDWNHQL